MSCLRTSGSARFLNKENGPEEPARLTLLKPGKAQADIPALGIDDLDKNFECLARRSERPLRLCQKANGLSSITSIEAQH
jgi:hypothetical protein